MTTPTAPTRWLMFRSQRLKEAHRRFIHGLPVPPERLPGLDLRASFWLLEIRDEQRRLLALAAEEADRG